MHTKGPWQRDKYGNLNDSNNKSVLFRSVSTLNAGGDPRIKEAEANTNLACAAPELLESLILVVSKLEELRSEHGYLLTPKYIADAYGAIRKATSS